MIGRPGASLRPAILHQPAFEQGLEHAARIDAAQLLDFGTRDRLAVGDDRERLQQRTAEPRRLGGEQLAHVERVLLGRAQLVAARDLFEHHAARARA